MQYIYAHICGIIIVYLQILFMPPFFVTSYLLLSADWNEDNKLLNGATYVLLCFSRSGTMKKKVSFRVVEASGWDEDYSTKELETHSPLMRGWRSPR